jgi:hypothetical protein
MKIIIKESRLHNAIYEYLTELFGNIYFANGYNVDEDREDKNILEFLNDESDDVLFDYVNKEFYDALYDGDLKDRFLDKAPLVTFSRDIFHKLNAMFGNHWIPIYKKWMMDKFGLPVETIWN